MTTDTPTQPYSDEEIAAFVAGHEECRATDPECSYLRWLATIDNERQERRKAEERYATVIRYVCLREHEQPCHAGHEGAALNTEETK